MRKLRQALIPIVSLVLIAVVVNALGLVDDRCEAAVVLAVDRSFPGGDATGISAVIGPGFVGCGPGVATLCRSGRELRVEAAPRRAVPQWASGGLVVRVPAGLALAGGAVTVRVRTADAPLSVLVRGLLGSRQVDLVALHQASETTRTVALPRGLGGLLVALSARRPVTATEIARDGDDAVAVTRVRLVVRDDVAPRLRATGAALDGAWHRGTVCLDAAASDAGVGVRRLEAVAGSARASAPAAGRGGGPFHPRPATFASRLCLDTTRAGSGERALLVRAFDGVERDGNAAAPVAGVLRIDNEAPQVRLAIAAETTSRRPQLPVRASDRTSGIAALRALLDGSALPLAPAADGDAVLVPDADLAYGDHVLEVTAADRAGGTTTATARFAVVDRDPPRIGALAPAPGARVAAGPVRVAASLADDGSGIDAESVRVAIDGLERSLDARVGPHGVVLAAGRLPAGSHRVVVVVRDAVGNRARASWAFRVTAPPPPPRRRPTLGHPGGPVRLVHGQARIRLGGRASPRVPLAIDVRRGRGWIVLGRVRAAADGRFALTVRASRRGSYVFRARSGRLRSAAIAVRVR